MKLTTVMILMVGGVLIYSAVKDKNPIQVLQMGLQGKSAPTAAPKPEPSSMNAPPPNTSPGQRIVSV